MTPNDYIRNRKALKMIFPTLTEQKIDELARNPQFMQWLEVQYQSVSGQTRTLEFDIATGEVQFRQTFH